MTNRTNRAVHLIAFAALLTACGGGGGDACVVGSTQVCNCTPSLEGVQSCDALGGFGACQCEGFDGGPPPRDGGGSTDGGTPTDDAATSDGGAAGCGCVWPARIEESSGPGLEPLGLRDSGDLIYYSQLGDGDYSIHVVDCETGSDRRIAWPPVAIGENLGRPVYLQGDVLAYSTWDGAPLSERRSLLVFWDLATESILFSEEYEGMETSVGTPEGRGHVLVSHTTLDGAGGTERWAEEWDPTGTRVASYRGVLTVTGWTPLPVGWRHSAGVGETNLVVDGVVTPVPDLIAPAGVENTQISGRGPDGLPLEDPFYKTLDEQPDLDTFEVLRADVAGTVLWRSAPIVFTSTGTSSSREARCGNEVVHDAAGNVWVACTDAAESTLVGHPDDAKSTSYLFQFDGESGALLTQHIYSHAMGNRPLRWGVDPIVTDTCGNTFARAPGPTLRLDVTGSGPLLTPVYTWHVMLDSFDGSGARRDL